MKKISELDSLSKGNQPKYLENNYWYKKNVLGYEGIAEEFSYLVSECMNISKYCVVAKYERTSTGCKSINLCKEHSIFIDSVRLINKRCLISIEELLESMNAEDRIKKYVDTIVGITNIQDFGKRLTCLLEFDYLIQNEDRHFKNICFLMSNSGEFDLVCFDNGDSLLSSTFEYPLERLDYEVNSKPFLVDFDNQLEIMHKLYGYQLSIDKALLHNFLDSWTSKYTDEASTRCKDVFLKQLDKFTRFNCNIPRHTHRFE